jgi:hypothetical protein
MSNFKINENRPINNIYPIRTQSPRKNTKIYYPSNFLKDNNYYRNQTYADLLNAYRQEQKITSSTFPTDKDYLDSIKIVFYTPPIDDKCGGTMVLHNLAKSINSFGYSNFKAYLYSYDHKAYPNDFCNSFYNPFLVDSNTIVIYPETIIANPLRANHVVRWVLLDLGLEVPKHHYKYAWDKKDIVYHWEPSVLKDSKQLVNIWTNPEIKRTNFKKDRSKRCYAFKKVNNLPKTLHKKIQTYHAKTDINIDKLSIKQIIETFNECETFYCYDPNTFFTIMAPLCGCITVLHPIDGVSRDSYFSSRIICHNLSGFCYDAGIAYGNDPKEIKRARQTLPEAQNQYNKLCSLHSSSVTEFVHDMVSIINGKQLQNTVEKVYYDNEVKEQA